VRTAVCVLAYGLLQAEAYLILSRLVLLWTMVSRESRLMRFLDFVVEPVLALIRNRLPRVGGWDLSPVVAVVLIEQVAAVVDHIGSGLYPSTSKLVLAIMAQVVLDLLAVLGFAMFLRVLLLLVGASEHNPSVKLIHRVSTPVTRHVERVFSPVRSVDVAALISAAACLGLYVGLRRVLPAALGVPL
jgi:uncharacterized protein YggT (Ycf19 family)